MSDSQAIYDRYQAALQAYSDVCANAPGQWHPPDVTKFTELSRLLLPHAESGDMLCQYALATILTLGLCCEHEERPWADQMAAREAATPWWIAAARQGFWPALDNLAVCGVGPEAEQAREGWRQLEQERRDLIGSSHGMPVYGPEFVQELSRRLYGKVVTR